MIGFLMKLLGLETKKPPVRRTGFISSPTPVQPKAPDPSLSVQPPPLERMPLWYQKFMQAPLDESENPIRDSFPEIDSEDVQKLIENCREILPEPPSGFSIYEKVADPNTPARDVAQAVGSDPALASLILKTVNTAAYGFGSRIESLGRAIVLMGYNAVKTIVLSQTLHQSFAGLDRQKASQIANHGKVVSALCWCFAKNNRSIDPNTMSTVGLLHDLGKLLALHPNIKAEIEKSSVPVPLAEAVLGAEFASSWNLPESISEVVKHQLVAFSGDYDSLNNDIKRQVAILGCANYLAEILGFGTGEDLVLPTTQVREVLGLGSSPKTWIETSSVSEIEKAIASIQKD